MAEFSLRTGTILKVIVTGYVSSAAPVASSAVLKTSGLRVSPATVRNEMVGLEGDGYIMRPHISAGGVPSDKGYRYFVDTLDPGSPVQEGAAAHLRTGFQNARHEFEAWAEAAAASLASVLGTLAFATTPRAQSATVKAVELVRLQETIVMLVVVMRETSIHQEIINTGQLITDLELEHTRNRLAEATEGKTAGDIEAAMSLAAGDLEHRALESTAGVLRQHQSETYGERVFQGLSRLLEQPELTSRPGHARKVVAAIEDEGSFAALASRAPGDGTPIVMIGSEVPLEDLRDFSVIVSRYGLPEEAQGVIGLVSPTRMQYDRVLPIVRHTAFALSTMTGQVYRG